MKFIVLSLCMTISAWGQPEIEKVRAGFKLAPNSEKEADKLITYLSNNTGDKNAVYLAYLGAVTTMKASWAFWPHQKLDYAGKGMKLINNAIQNDPGNLEVRWIRFSVESQMPSFLGYNHQKEDKHLIYQMLKSEHFLKMSSQLWVRDVAAFMKKYAEPSAEELKILSPYLR